MTAPTLFADRYLFERRLGIGGMATVQLAMDTRLERHVAVKLLAEHLAADSNFVSRFRREALAAAQARAPEHRAGLRHRARRSPPGASSSSWSGSTGRAARRSSRSSGRLEPAEAVEILRQACRGLDYAHRNGVVHRDVKPGNLLRGRESGQVKLADFGIAKAAEQSDITKIGSVLGTAAYLSPEQARGEPAGPRSDLYALGVVAYQLLAGRLPYEAASLTDLARQQDTAAPRAAARARPGDPGRGLRRRRRARWSATPSAASPTPPRWTARSARRCAASPRRRAAGADETEATRMLDQTALTTPLARTTRPAARQAAPPRRRLEPIAEPPAPPRAPGAGRPRPPPTGAARARRRRARAFRTLLVLVAAGRAAVGAFVLITQGSEKQVQLNEDVQGGVEQSVQQLEDLIRENTR